MRTYPPSPRGQAPMVTWRQWLLPLGAAAGIVALLALSPGAPSGLPLSYSQFLADVGAGSVRAVTINPAGQVTGSLATGQPFTTTIPVALGDRTLAGQLAAHHVQVTATAGHVVLPAAGADRATAAGDDRRPVLRRGPRRPPGGRRHCAG